MPALSLPPAERSRKAHSRLLTAMQEPGTQRNLAQVLGVSEATVSRIKNEKLEDALTLIYQLGFKCVPGDHECVPTEYLQALRVMAKAHMAQPIANLHWDDA